MLNFYKNINCCQDNRAVDDSFNRFLTEREYVLEMLAENPQQLIELLWKQLLSDDAFCMYHGGQHLKYSPYLCPPCTIISRLVDKHELAIPFMIESGERVGDMVILISISAGERFLILNQQAKQRAIKFLAKHSNMLECGSQAIEPLEFLQCDLFTNNLLVWWAVDRMLQVQQLPYTLDLFTAYICRNDGFLLSKAATIGSYFHLREKCRQHNWDITCIISQLAVILDTLSKAYFSHGNASLDTLLFSESENVHEYEQLTIECHYVTHLIDFSYASINVDNTRIYPKNSLESVILDYSNLSIKVVDQQYFIDEKTDILFSYIRYSGLAIYASSFDFYCYLVSLCSDEYFYQRIKSTKLWKVIWPASEIAKMEHRLETNLGREVDLARLLGGVWLKCNVVKECLNV